MLDIKFIVANPDTVKRNAQIKGDACDVDRIVALADEVKTLTQEREKLKTELNRINKALGPLLGMVKGGKKADDPKVAAAIVKVGDVKAFPQLGDLAGLVNKGADALQEALRSASDEVKTFDPKIDKKQAELDGLAAYVPNMTDETVPKGKSEEDNVEVSKHGKKPAPKFAPKAHWDLADALGLFHAERAAKLTGSGFYMTSGDLTRLEWALLWFFLDRAHAKGYTPVMVPFMANRDVMFATGQIPKFQEDMYQLDERDQFYLIPTAEAPLTSIHAGEIVDGETLPLRYTAYTPCFRREAGAAGKDTRGLLRVHQFNKVELFKLVHPDTARAEHAGLRDDAMALLDELGLHYRVLELCDADLSFAAMKCWDLEVWAPGVDKYLEVSSISHFGDFQARRADTRFKIGKDKPQFCHTINGSGLATPRTLVAILETYQRQDGTIEVPKVLRPYMNGQEAIEPRG